VISVTSRDADSYGGAVAETNIRERQNLGGPFFGLPPEVITAVRATFGVPHDHEPIGAIAIGQPAPGGSTGSAWRGRRTPWIGSSTEAAGEPGRGLVCTRSS
jgi:hypothetical protein